MKIPESVYQTIHDLLWTKADEMGWTTLSDQQKSALYEEWIRSDVVGQVLSRYLDTGSIRVYIKDTIMKPYGRERLKDARPVLSLLGLPPDEPVAKEFIKPHGRLFRDGRVVCWGLARDWKDILFAVFERAQRIPRGKPFSAVLMYSSGKTAQSSERLIVNEAARRLQIEKLIWHDE